MPGIKDLAAVLGLLAAFMPAGGVASPSPGREEPIRRVGDETCLMCHEEVHEAYRETVHARLAVGRTAEGMPASCEACHGPGGEHADDPLVTNIRTFDPDVEGESRDDGNGACLTCHEGGDRVHWPGSTHARREVGCTGCHEVMRKVSERYLLRHEGSVTRTCTSCHLLRGAQTLRSSHMPLREGAMDCTSCHQPHGGPGPSLLREPTVAQSCYRCHAEKRGPFLWEHPPAREDCSNCHAVHGSIYERLLIRDVPRLCMQCHNATRHPTTPQASDSRFVFSRACLNCHPAVHGSNHPSGYRFQR